RAADGTFPEATVHRLVQDRLREYAEQVREFGYVSPAAVLDSVPSPADRIPGGSNGFQLATMSSADNSPGTYCGNLAAGKIDNNEMPPTIKNDTCSARSRALAFIATAFSTWSCVAEVAPSTLLSS